VNKNAKANNFSALDLKNVVGTIPFKVHIELHSIPSQPHVASMELEYNMMGSHEVEFHWALTKSEGYGGRQWTWRS
jgi:hypothetical protein